MGKKRKEVVALLIATSLLLQGCEMPTWLQSRDAPQSVYVVIAEDKDTFTVTDGTFEIVYSKETDEILSRILCKRESITPSLYVMNLGTQYSIEYVRPATYKINYQSLCGYIGYLKEQGFKITEQEASSEFLDITLRGDGRVRIVYTPSLSNIFYCDKDGNFLEPPYLNSRKNK